MTKYSVHLWRAVSIQSTTVEVEAENKEAAEQAAMQIALEKGGYFTFEKEGGGYRIPPDSYAMYSDDWWGDAFRADPYPEVSHVEEGWETEEVKETT